MVDRLGGATTLYGSSMSQITAANENLIKLKSAKQAGGAGVTTLGSMSMASTEQLAAMRNALGDIGNRIQVGGGGAIKPGGEPLKTTVAAWAKEETTAVAIEDVIMQNEASVIVMDNDDDDDDVEGESLIDEEEEPLPDIDEMDADNPQLAAEYVKEIYVYLNKLERRYRVSPNFLDGKTVTAKMRSVLIDWLIQVHLKFHLLPETLYGCIQIIDAYLQAQHVAKSQLQLVGVTAMFVASKYEEMYVPAIEDFAYMTDNTYTKSEIRLMEISILKTLDFSLGKPLPLHFLRRFSRASMAEPKQHSLAKYLMELSLHDVEFASFDPSYLAASALCMAFKLLKGPRWDRLLVHHSGYTSGVLSSGMTSLAKLVLKSNATDYKYKAAFNKYATSKFMRMSVLPELSGEQIKDMAAGKMMP